MSDHRFPTVAVEPSPTPAICISGLSHQYQDSPVLNELSLSVKPGEFVALLGASGCGKTTLLRSVAGLLRPTQGHIRLSGKPVFDSDSRAFVGPEQRDIGMVFQDYALWPHMKVQDIVGFPLEARGVGRSERKAQVLEALERVQLAAFANRYPSELSGGQQQRVGLARAICARPAVLLFDEPLSNLDAGLRETLGRDMVKLVKSLGITALYVTHDRQEALGLADRVAMMDAGRILQIDTPENMFQHPQHAKVARFLQLGEWFQGQVQGGHFLPSNTPDGTSMSWKLPSHVSEPDGTFDLMISHSGIRELGSDELTSSSESCLALQVQVQIGWVGGDHHWIEAVTLGGNMPLKWKSPHAIKPGLNPTLGMQSSHLHFFCSQTGNLIRSHQPGALT